MISFYCKACRKDFDAVPAKKKNRWAEWFETKCRCGRKTIRYITGKKNDPYYRESKRVIMERDAYHKDLIQYGQTGFQTFYKKQWDTFEAQRERYENEVKKRTEERDKFYARFKGSGHQDIVRKVLEKEEELCRT